MQSNQNPLPLSLVSQSAFIAKHIQSVQFDHMFHHSQSSWPWWAPIRSVPLSQCVDAHFVGLTSLLIFSLLLLLNWTLGAKSSAPMWVSVSSPIHGQMKILWWFARYFSVWLWNKTIRHYLICCPGKNQGTSPWTRKASKVKSFADPKMAPLIKIFTSLLPFPPFLYPTHPIPPSSLEFYLSKFSLEISPYIHPQISMHQILPGFTLLFTFSKITNYKLNILYLWLGSTYELVYTIFLFLGLCYLTY